MSADKKIQKDRIANIKKYGRKKEIPPTHHPDFYKLNQDSVLASSYFRRGGWYGSPCDDFIYVIKALKIVFHSGLFSFFKEYEKVKMLVGGIGESQEPFSLLATVKNLIGNEKISDLLDMHTVDLQGQPTESTLFKQSFYDSVGEPRFVKSSFVEDDAVQYDLPSYVSHRVSDEIFEYLSDVYNNHEKAKWQTRIQDALKEYPDRDFDVVSINNTLIYVKEEERIDCVKNIFRVLRMGGIFISDNRPEGYKEVFTPENSVEIYPGIFQKL